MTLNTAEDTNMKRKTRQNAGRVAIAKAADATISAWEDDPEPAVLVTRPIPDIAKKPLAFNFPKPAPAPGIYQPGTEQFRYWTAAEALRRGADFWAPRVPGGTWEVGPALKVILDEGEDLNAYYDRKALNFFHGPGKGGTVYSGESPDVVCHEMGHAILDSIKPQLWGAASHEAAAFHESFADMSAILSALQLPSLRDAILSNTQGHLYRSSRLSRLAEQLGTAIRMQYPDAVDPDCLRNAVNSFTYHDPVSLPQMAPASQLSSEAHSFSRVFTGAFFEILAGLLDKKAATAGAPTGNELLLVSGEIADILVNGIKQAPVVPNWYAQVAAAMVQTSAAVNSSYPPILKAVFVRRSILSLNSASNVQMLQSSMAAVAKVKVSAVEPLDTIALSASDYGLDRPLLVEAASNSRKFLARAAATEGNGSLDPTSSSTAARAFVDDLFSRGRVDYHGLGHPEARMEHRARLRSHRLVEERGAIRLERCLFDCGFCS
jgi:hypothetical protein